MFLKTRFGSIRLVVTLLNFNHSFSVPEPCTRRYSVHNMQSQSLKRIISVMLVVITCCDNILSRVILFQLVHNSIHVSCCEKQIVMQTRLHLQSDSHSKHTF